jgi:hypothetical protein
MKITSFKLMAVMAAGAALAGCATQPESGTPIDAGLYQVGKGLASIKLGELTVLTNSVFHGQKDFATGLFATDFSYVFNVQRSQSDANVLTIEADAAVPQSPVSGKAGDTLSTSSSNSRGNQIIINFTSPLFTTTTITTTNKTTAGSNTVTTVETKVERTITDPQKLADFLKVVGGNGLTPAATSMEINPQFRLPTPR